jgi:DNA-binding response OmpR family regulator
MNTLGKILVVDDEASIRFYLQETLERDGHQVVAVESGEAALKLAQSECFDLALIDLRLKGMGGIDLLKALRRILPDMAVIVLTAHASLDTAVEALRQGAHDYLFKPCTSIALRESVGSGLLKRQREARQKALLTQLERALSVNLEELRSTVAENNAISQAVAVEEAGLSEARFIQWHDLLIDLTRHVITLEGKLLELSPTEFNLLAHLASQAPRVVPPQELVREVLGYVSEPWEARDVARYHIYRIRQKIQQATGRKDLINNIRGIGYTLCE